MPKTSATKLTIIVLITVLVIICVTGVVFVIIGSSSNEKFLPSTQSGQETIDNSSSNIAEDNEQESEDLSSIDNQLTAESYFGDIENQDIPWETFMDAVEYLEEDATRGAGDVVYDAMIYAMDNQAAISVPGVDGQSYIFQIIGIDHDGDGGRITLQAAQGSRGADEQFGKDNMNDSERMRYISGSGYVVSGGSSVGGWENCAMRVYVNGAGVYDKLSSSVQESIKPSTKVSSDGIDNIVYTTDNIFFLSASEVYGYSQKVLNGSKEGSQYQFYADKGITVTSHDSRYMHAQQWLRSVYNNGNKNGDDADKNSTCFCYIDLSGYIKPMSATSEFNIVPCFSV